MKDPKIIKACADWVDAKDCCERLGLESNFDNLAVLFGRMQKLVSRGSLEYNSLKNAFKAVTQPKLK